MNRRGFLGTLGAVLADPRALKLAAAAAKKPGFVTLMPGETYTTGWIPLPSPLPRSVMGRIEWIETCLEEGWIDAATAARLLATTDP